MSQLHTGQPITAIPREFCQNLRYFFSDIDDTMTHRGLLPADAYRAIWQLFEHGVQVVPVTGRPAGWCDHIARMWPVTGVIGENGAFYFAYDRATNTMQREYLLTEAERRESQNRLQAIRERVLVEVPGCRISADQPYRIADLAIDYCEDVAPLSKADVRRICEIVEEEGATYKVSSIHVNCWYGEHTKIACLHRFLRDYTGAPLENVQEQIAFIGDSPNDEPIFKELKHSMAVANIRHFLDELDFPPTYITTQETAAGFCEAIAEIVGKRG